MRKSIKTSSWRQKAFTVDELLSMNALDPASPVHVVERPEADKSRALPFPKLHLKRFYPGQARAPHSTPPSGLSFDHPEVLVLPCAHRQAVPTICGRGTVNCRGRGSTRAKIKQDPGAVHGPRLIKQDPVPP